MTEKEMLDRTKKFALRVLKLVAALPNTIAGRTIGGQLARSGTSVASNYRAACRGRSKPEFIAKLGIAEEEADESCLWMEIIIDDGLMPRAKITSPLTEGYELTKILAASKIKARQRK